MVANPSKLDQLQTQFLSIFPHRFDSAIKPVGGSRWIKTGSFHRLSDAEIVAAVLGTSPKLIAISIGQQSSFAAIVINANSMYASSIPILRIRQALQNRGLTSTLYKASGSDDLHLFLFFRRPASSDLVKSKLMQLLANEGFNCRAGQLEIVDQDSPIPLPLQSGFAWLNDQLTQVVTRDQISFEAALALFCSDLRKFAIEPGLLTDVAETDTPQEVLDVTSSTGSPLVQSNATQRTITLFTQSREPQVYQEFSAFMCTPHLRPGRSPPPYAISYKCRFEPSNWKELSYA